MYYAADENKKKIVAENGAELSVKEFKSILEKGNVDMTLMTQRLVLMNFDWDELENFYNA